MEKKGFPSRRGKRAEIQQGADRQGWTPRLGAAAGHSNPCLSLCCSLSTAGCPPPRPTASPSVGSILKQDTARSQKVKHAATRYVNRKSWLAGGSVWGLLLLSTLSIPLLFLRKDPAHARFTHPVKFLLQLSEPPLSKRRNSFLPESKEV